MRAMILAAGRGKRMGALTQDIPKPLLKVKGKYLIEYMLLSLKKAGIQDILINVFYLADRMIQALGNGERYGVNISYSKEEEPLETGGGILQALPFFQNQPFLVVSSDILTDFPLASMMQKKNKHLAHLVLVDNPPWHAQGDFGLKDGYVNASIKPFYTFANLGWYHPDIFSECKPGYFRLSEVLLPAINQGLITGEYYQGNWHNLGTPEDLALVEKLTCY